MGFNSRMRATCRTRCVQTNYRAGALSTEEGVCIDSCVAKYMSVHNSVGETLNKLDQQDKSHLQTQGQK